MSDLFIHPVYLSARAAIVTPERAIPLTLYATQKWLPRLGPERWCLVMLLRSMCIDSQRRSDGTKRVTCSWRQLADMMDVHEETVASWLKHKPIANDKPWRQIIPSDDKAKYLSLFIPRLRYAYETHNGKTRRLGFVLEVLMEDPVAPEDEDKLRKQMELLQLQQGQLALETYRLAEDIAGDNSNLPQISELSRKQQNPDLHYVNRNNPGSRTKANPLQLDLHNAQVNPDFSDLPEHVKQNNPGSEGYVNQPNSELLDHKSELSEKNVNKLDKLIQQLKQNNLRKNIRKDAFEPVIKLTETLLADTHSTGMLYKVLNAFYPERLDLYVAAVRVSLDAALADPRVNRGAVFVRTVREFAEIIGIDLGFKRSPADTADEDFLAGNLGSQAPGPRVSPLAAPSVDEAVWAETQLVLRRQMTQATYDTIIQGTVLLGSEDHHYLVGAHTELAKEWLENRLHDIVQRALASVVDKAVTVEFILLDEAR